MKKYKKNKFSFLWDNGSRKEPINGEFYFRKEWKIKLKFLFSKPDKLRLQLSHLFFLCIFYKHCLFPDQVSWKPNSV